MSLKLNLSCIYAPSPVGQVECQAVPTQSGIPGGLCLWRRYTDRQTHCCHPWETHWVGEHQGCGRRERGVTGGFLEMATLRLGLNERIGGSQEEKTGKGVLGNSFGEVTGVQEHGTDSASPIFTYIGNKVW